MWYPINIDKNIWKTIIFIKQIKNQYSINYFSYNDFISSAVQIVCEQVPPAREPDRNRRNITNSIKNKFYKSVYLKMKLWPPWSRVSKLSHKYRREPYAASSRCALAIIIVYE